MSFNTVFKEYGDVINFLKNHDNPACFTVNYRPKEDDYELWIGNQPYENYEKMIEELETELVKADIDKAGYITQIELLEEQAEKYQRLRNKILEQTIQKNHEALKKLADS
ncbi:hypothetical protein COJ96_05895 [Bacillus sp. AFS073361]|uniref:hypothetical protein n=1 Tax=Bacillus sp. AFS073361 TaxID=2033511 RepID=UPI000BF74469|nr:hypothetical protein [Bacillus sp. AFS073361]PFP30243.1 hypothetical protein COJ96_05895 [Bacillus sp. AFS073361]